LCTNPPASKCFRDNLNSWVTDCTVLGRPFKHFARRSSSEWLVIDTHLSQEIGTVLLSILFFFTYLLFSMLAVHGIRVAYHLRHGQARYHEHYREGMQKQIDKIKKKFPKL